LCRAGGIIIKTRQTLKNYFSPLNCQECYLSNPAIVKTIEVRFAALPRRTTPGDFFYPGDLQQISKSVLSAAKNRLNAGQVLTIACMNNE
jgi:hypothetical protein